MNYFKDKIVPILIGAILSAIGALLISIFTDIYPLMIPALRNITSGIYIKIIFFVFLGLIISIVLNLVLFSKNKNRIKTTYTGKYKGLRWKADIEIHANLYDKYQIHVMWICPIHDVFFSRKDALVENSSYSILYCKKCNKEYQIRSKGAVIYPEEAGQIIETKIRTKFPLIEK